MADTLLQSASPSAGMFVRSGEVRGRLVRLVCERGKGLIAMSRNTNGQVDRLSPRTIIVEILRNMRESSEEMYSHCVVPSSYHVYLHERDFTRLQAVIPRLIADAKHALDCELSRMNRLRLVDRLIVGRPTRFEAADREWKIEIFQDPDEEQAPGQARIQSQLLLSPNLGIREGSITRFTVTRTDDALPDTPSARGAIAVNGSPLAELKYFVAGEERTCRMTEPELLIGRGGPDAIVDLEISNPSISEIHARIHSVLPAGVFFLENRGKYGTTVNGKAVPKGAEVSISKRSRIGMAYDTVFVEFIAMG
jgi:hypothetical protein